MNLSFKQVEIAKSLFEIEDAKFLDEIQAMIQNYRTKKATKSDTSRVTPTSKNKVDEELEALHLLAKQPTPEHIPLEEIAKEQGYNSKKLGKTLENIDYELFADESLEDMLNTLTK
jgi:hypothetical protein